MALMGKCWYIIQVVEYADEVIYLPMDSSSNAQKFISQINPSVVLWVKYEFWHYYLTELHKRNIPVLLVSGIFRRSQPFFKSYGGFWKNMLSHFSIFFLQNQTSATLLKEIGLQQESVVCGDTRFDRVIAIAEQPRSFPEIESFCSGQNTIVAGSTWEEDEAEWVHFAKANPQVKIIIAPHEVDAENIKSVLRSFPGSITYSSWSKSVSEKFTTANTNVLIIDNVGMLSSIYRYADIAYVGGGFGNDGVHNVLEAAVYGIPVLHGPEFEKYAEAIDLVECGGAIVINSAVELEKMVNLLLTNEELLRAKGKVAKDFVYSSQGATTKIIDHIYAKRLLTN